MDPDTTYPVIDHEPMPANEAENFPTSRTDDCVLCHRPLVYRPYSGWTHQPRELAEQLLGETAGPGQDGDPDPVATQPQPHLPLPGQAMLAQVHSAFPADTPRPWHDGQQASCEGCGQPIEHQVRPGDHLTMAGRGGWLHTDLVSNIHKVERPAGTTKDRAIRRRSGQPGDYDYERGAES